MALVNVGVFVGTFLLAYFIGWHVGADEVLGVLRDFVSTFGEGKDDGEDGNDNQGRVRNDNGDLEI